MSVIQKIQDKYGKVMAIIIGISLVIFVVMLAFENGGSLFKGGSTTIGKINGTTIDIKDFQNAVAQQTQMLEARGMGSGEALNQQAQETAWNSEIAKALLAQEAKKLGLEVGSKELNSLLFGTHPPQEIAQAFTDPQTGQYNAQAAQQQINQIKTKGSPEQKAQINAFLDQMAFQHLAEKYDALLTTSINFPKWMIEKQNAQNSLIAKVSFVRAPYSTISDSAVKVSESDIQAYINKHKNDFKQQESRSIAYVAFSAQPNAADTAAAKEKMMAIKAAFDSTRDVKTFLLNQGVNNFYDGYISKSRIQVPMKDSIFAVGAGHTYGPYVDAHSYALAKILGVKNMPDTVKVRHILISTVQQDPQSGQTIPLRDTATAKALADSIALAIRNGSPFDSLVHKFSGDPSVVQNNGVYDNVPSGQMAPAFNDFIFGNPVGTKGVVKTEFGYHYIEILSQKGNEAGYKIAYVTKSIDASAETESTAQNAAIAFAGQSKDEKAFTAHAEKLQKEKGIQKALATDIPPSGSTIQGIGSSRTLVKNIYHADLGDVLQPERVGDFYVVSVVTEINKEGTMSPAKAKMMVEPLLINEKKAELIKQKIGNVSTLEAAATALKQPVAMADSLRFNGQANPQLGFEPKIIGAAFNKANVNKVVAAPIAGTQGVYVVKVDNISATPLAAANVEEERKMRYMQAKQQAAFQGLQALREASAIKDYRSKFY